MRNACRDICDDMCERVCEDRFLGFSQYLVIALLFSANSNSNEVAQTRQKKV